MKTFKPRYEIVYYFGLPVGLIASCFAFFFPEALNLAVDWMGLFFIAVLLMTLHPNAKQKLGEQKRYSLWKWLGSLWLLQIAVLFIYLGITDIIFKQFLATQLPTLTKQTRLLQGTLNQLTIDWGLFPWALSTIIGISTAYFVYVREQVPFFYSSFESLIQTNNVFVMPSFEYYVHTSIFLAIFTTLGLSNLELNQIISDKLHLPTISGLQLKTMLGLSIVMIMLGTSKTLEVVRKLYQKKVSIGIYILLLTVWFQLSFLLVQGLFYIGRDFLSLLPSFTEGQLLPFEVSWPLKWRIFNWSWWLACAPLLGTGFAFVSRGYSIRVMIIGCLSLPTLATVVGHYIPIDHTTLIMAYQNWGANHLGTISCSVLLILVIFFFRFQDNARLLHGFMSSYRTKDLRASHYVTILASFLMILVSLPVGGLHTLFLLSVVVGLPFLVVCVIITIATIKLLSNHAKQQS